MKKIVVLVLIIFVLGGVVGYFIGLSTSAKPPSSSSGPASPLPTTAPTVPSPAPSPPLTTTPPPAVPSTPSPSPAAGKEVKYEFDVTDISGTGLSRTITAQITNTGNIDAHNAWAKVEVFSQGSRIKLNNSDYLRVDLGLIKSGTTVSKQVALQVGVLDALKLTQSGAQLVLTIYSDESTQTFNYDFTP